jgi:Protein of unknown function (DUF3592)
MNTNLTVQRMTIPPELQRAIPRDVTLSGSGKAVMVLAFLLIFGGFALGAWLSSLSRQQNAQYAAERADAVSTQARVTEVQRISGKGERWRVRYTFDVEGEIFDGATSMRRSDARAYQSGGVVRVMYVPSEPERNWVAGHEPKPLPGLLATLIGITTVLIGLLLWWIVQRQRRMLERWRTAIARVIEAKRYSTGKSAGVKVKFEFTTLEGTVQQGRTNTTIAAAPAQGSEVVVLYDNDNPKRTVLYPLALVKVKTRD